MRYIPQQMILKNNTRPYFTKISSLSIASLAAPE